MSQKGVDSYVIESLFRNREQKLSRLHITKDYRIILTDYDNIEIVMTPLPKALFLLYQKHPNGIMFSYLSDLPRGTDGHIQKGEGNVVRDVFNQAECGRCHQSAEEFREREMLAYQGGFCQPF